MIRLRQLLGAAAILPATCSLGCLASPSPVADGIPVRRLPDEVLGRPKSELQPVPLNLLRRSEVAEYRLDRGDTLGVFIENVLGNPDQPIPINAGATGHASLGYPVTVREDGTILLPDLPPFSVRGKTLAEAKETIIGMVTGNVFLVGSKRLLVPGTEKVVVDLVQPRSYRVLVVREDSSATTDVAGAKKGTGVTVELTAYKNDLLEALNRSGGPPGPDSKNEVVIRRGTYNPAEPAQGYVRIPLRVRPEEPLVIAEPDIILNEGDTVFIEARDADVFYTSGLAGAHQVALPRDRDLRVTDAIANIPSPLLDVHSPLIGGVTVVRRPPGAQGEIRIRVDLAEAFRDPRENILIHPGDIIVLHDRPATPHRWMRALRLP